MTDHNFHTKILEKQNQQDRLIGLNAAQAHEPLDGFYNSSGAFISLKDIVAINKHKNGMGYKGINGGLLHFKCMRFLWDEKLRDTS